MANQQQNTDESISIREFARRMQVRDTSVHKALNSGKIVHGVTGEGRAKKILYETARAEWEANRDPTYAQRSDKLTAALGTVPDNAPPAPDQAQSAGDQGSIQAYKRMREGLAAKKLQLELQKMMGEVVDKKLVYTQLFEAGQVLKARLLAIPDRVVDDMLAQHTREDAYTILYDALVEGLSEFSDTLKTGIFSDSTTQQ